MPALLLHVYDFTLPQCLANCQGWGGVVKFFMLPTTAPKSSASRSPLPTLPPVSLPVFEGPLDLLLHLVRQGRMDIFDLPMTLLCDQYLAYLSTLESRDLTIAGEFLVMAATLLEIKSRMLLPAPPKDPPLDENLDTPDDPRAELVERLLEYGKYQAIAESLKAAESDRRHVFFRSPTSYCGSFRIPPRFGELSASQLLKALERMLANVGAGEQSITSVRRQKITLRMAMRQMLHAAQQAGSDGLPMLDLLPEPPFARIDVVLVFLALLELLKQGSILVAQEGFCGPIHAFFVPEDKRAALIGDEEEAVV